MIKAWLFGAYGVALGVAASVSASPACDTLGTPPCGVAVPPAPPSLMDAANRWFADFSASQREQEAEIIEWEKANAALLGPAMLFDLAYRVFKTNPAEGRFWFSLANLRERYDEQRCLIPGPPSMGFLTPGIAPTVMVNAASHPLDEAAFGEQVLEREKAFPIDLSPGATCDNHIVPPPGVQGVRPAGEWPAVHQRVRDEYASYVRALKELASLPTGTSLEISASPEQPLSYISLDGAGSVRWTSDDELLFDAIIFDPSTPRRLLPAALNKNKVSLVWSASSGLRPSEGPPLCSTARACQEEDPRERRIEVSGGTLTYIQRHPHPWEPLPGELTLTRETGERQILAVGNIHSVAVSPRRCRVAFGDGMKIRVAEICN